MTPPHPCLFRIDRRRRPPRLGIRAAFERLEDRFVLSLANGLIGYWPFDGSGADHSGNARDLTLYGGVGFAPGLFGQALDMNRDSSQYAARPIDDQDIDFGVRDFTIQVWIRFDTTSWEQVLIEKFDGAGGPGWTFTKLGGNSFRVHASEPVDTPVQSIATSVWHQAIVRKIGSLLDIHWDGSPLISPTDVSLFNDTYRPLLIGKRNDGDGRNFTVDGRIDEVAIWDRPLADAEIAALYNGGAGMSLTAFCASCADAYTVDEDGALVVDFAAGVLANDGPKEGENLVTTAASPPRHGELTLADNGSFRYVPSPEFFGVDTFNYTIVSDKREARNAVVSITVNARPDPPIAMDDLYRIGVGGVLNVAPAGFLTNDLNPDADLFSAVIESTPAQGTLVYSADGAFAYTPNAGFVGNDAFTYRVRNAVGESNTATVEIIVVPTITPESVIPLTTPFLGVINLAMPVAEGGFYFAGSFSGTRDWDPGPEVTAFTSVGDRDNVIALYATDGVLLWARQIGGPALEFARSLAVDRDGNLYVKGESWGTTFSVNGKVFQTSGPSVYYTKLDVNGNFLWTVTGPGGAYTQNNRSLAIDDSSEDRSQWRLYTVSLEESKSNEELSYFTRLNAQNGETIETRFVTLNHPEDYHGIEDVFVDEHGLVTTIGSVYFGDVAAGGTEVTRWDAANNILWSTVFSGPADQRKPQVVVDAQGNTYVEAIFNGTVRFTDDPANDMTSHGSAFSAYVSALDDAGNWRWATLLSATGTVEGARIALALDAAGNLFTTGEFRGGAAFGNIQLASAGDSDAYIAQLSPDDGAVVGAWRIGGILRDFTGSIGADAVGNVFTQVTVRSSIADVPIGQDVPAGEYTLVFRAATTTPTQGDVTGDGRVDRLDAAMMAANFAGPVFIGAAGGDFDSDGRLSLLDIAILQQNLTPLAAPSARPPASSPSADLATMSRRLAETLSSPQSRSRAEILHWLTARSDGTSTSAKPLRATRRARATPSELNNTVDQAFAQTESWNSKNKIAAPLRAARTPAKNLRDLRG